MGRVAPSVIAREQLQELAKQDVVLARPQDIINLCGPQIECPGQVVLLILAWRRNLELGALEHPLITDFGQQLDAKSISKQNQFRGPSLLDDLTNPRQAPKTLRIIVAGFQLDVAARGFHRTAHHSG